MLSQKNMALIIHPAAKPRTAMNTEYARKIITLRLSSPGKYLSNGSVIEQSSLVGDIPAVLKTTSHSVYLDVSFHAAFDVLSFEETESLFLLLVPLHTLTFLIQYGFFFP